MSEQTNSQLCIYCGASLEIHKGEKLITCPFCETANPILTTKQESVLRRFMLTVHLNKDKAREFLVADLEKLPNSPPDLERKLILTEAELKYVPYYLINVRGQTQFQGKGKSANYANRFKSGYQNILFYLKPETDNFQEMKQYTIFAGNNLPREISNYTIAARGRQYFNKQEAVKNAGEIIEPDKSETEARETAISLLKDYQTRIVKEEVSIIDNLDQKYEIDEISLVFCPIWFLKFKIEGSKNYRAILDASNGRTVFTQSPTRTSYFIFLGFMTVLFLGLGVSGYALMSYLNYTAIGIFLIIVGFSFTIEGLILGLRANFKEKVT